MELGRWAVKGQKFTSTVHLLSPITLAISLFPARTLSIELREAK